MHCYWLVVVLPLLVSLFFFRFLRNNFFKILNFTVNDLGGGRDGMGKSLAADNVVEEIIQLGGTAVADYSIILIMIFNINS